MKKYILLLLILPFIGACSKDDFRNNNRYLPNYNFSIDINLDLPLYSQLQFPSNPVRVTQLGIGINGVIVMNVGGSYVAFEASCPNQALSSCSILEIKGILAKCPCDGVEYSLFTGQPSTKVEFPLKQYRVQMLAPNMIRVYN
jgi:nitrite reductase/ring-hydroxylating ferredoxin subunit